MPLPGRLVPALVFTLASTLGCLTAYRMATPDRIEAVAADPERQASLTRLIDGIRSGADAFVFLSGGASRMTSEHEAQLFGMLDALGMVAKERRLAVGDGGTDAGIMRAAGQVRKARRGAFALVGVAPAAEITPAGTTRVDPNHSHIVAVRPADAGQSGSWGSETATMYWLFAKLAEGRPSVTVVANGGSISLEEVEANVRAGRRMILVEGSGRAADALVSLVRGTTPAEEEVARLRTAAESRRLVARPDLYRIVPLSAGKTGLRDAILEELTSAR